MSKRLKALLAISGLFVGCAPPTQIVPVPFPGMPVRRIPPPPLDGGAQALGEQAPTTAAAAPIVTSKEITPPTPVGQEVTTKSGIKVTTLKEGNGAEVKPGQQVKVAYVGKLTDGTQFDANPNGYDVSIATGQVIKGWDQGVPGMKVGERRRLVIPPELGYGGAANGKIPANSTLIFEVEVLGVK